MCGRGASEVNEEGRSTFHGIAQKRSSESASGKERGRGRHRLCGPPARSRLRMVKDCLKAATAPKHEQTTAILLSTNTRFLASSRYYPPGTPLETSSETDIGARHLATAASTFDRSAERRAQRSAFHATTSAP